MLRRRRGQKPYIEYEEGQAALRRIIVLRNAGMSYATIAYHLNLEEFPTKRKGVEWYDTTVRRILRASKILLPVGTEEAEWPPPPLVRWSGWNRPLHEQRKFRYWFADGQTELHRI